MRFKEIANQNFIEPYIRKHEENNQYRKSIDHPPETKSRFIKKLSTNYSVQNNIKSFNSWIKNYIENKKI